MKLKAIGNCVQNISVSTSVARYYLRQARGLCKYLIRYALMVGDLRAVSESPILLCLKSVNADSCAVV